MKGWACTCGVALDLLAIGAWPAAGALGLEASDPMPFLDPLTGYGSPRKIREQ